MTKRLLFFILVVSIFVPQSCDRDADYRIVPPKCGDTISESDIRGSLQVLTQFNKVYILKDYSKDPFDSEYYVLELDSSRTIISAAYASSLGVKELTSQEMILFKGPITDERMRSRKGCGKGVEDITYYNIPVTGFRAIKNKLINKFQILDDGEIWLSYSFSGGSQYFSSLETLKSEYLIDTFGVYSIENIRLKNESIYVQTVLGKNATADHFYFQTSMQRDSLLGTLSTF